MTDYRSTRNTEHRNKNKNPNERKVMQLQKQPQQQRVLSGSTQQHRVAPQGKKLWKVELRRIIDANKTKHALKDKTVSTRTKEHRNDVLFQSFTELRALGYKLDDPSNLREKHFVALLDHWIENKLSASTIQGKASVLRVFCTWIGRPGMIKTLKEYVEDASLVTRKQAAQVDKSWIGNGVSFQDILKLVDAYDSQAGAQLRIIKAFGLRREEAICLQPIRAMKLGEHRQAIFVEKGTKNGLKRYVSIDNDEKRAALEFVCQLAKVTDAHIGWEGLTLKQAVKRMANIMQKFGVTKKGLGVTLHGLRHERLQDIHEEITGEPCAIRGGKLENIDPELELQARHIMTMEAGHARLGITTAYSGKFDKKYKPLD